jgi:hypothetical protein
MLTESYLFDSNGPDQIVEGQITRFVPPMLSRLKLIVAREACLYAHLNCSGVPRLKLGSFAKLQTEQLSPFQNFGAYAVRQKHTLHVWIWDKSLETNFAEKHQGRAAHSVVPQSVLGSPQTNGVTWLRYASQKGIEAQLWQNEQLIDSLYFESTPSADDWANAIVTQPEIYALGWPAALPRGSNTPITPGTTKPWGRNLLAKSLNLPKIQAAPIAKAILWLATAVLAASTAAWISERNVHQKAITEGVESQKQRLDALEPEQQAREATQGVARWLASAQALSPRPSKAEVLTEIATMLTQQGLTVRELEMSPPTVSATLIPATDANFRLTAVIGAIEANPMFHDARFVDVADNNGYKFTWRLRSDAANPQVGARP